MQITFSQKNDLAQKKDASSAAFVLDLSSQSESLQRNADMANGAVQCEVSSRLNNTGMPDDLKTGIESLSGFSMDDVRVHYNSSKPATVQALAYTQGTDIHVAPGQEKHLPHEAWHVAQQMAGRVSPKTNINGMPVNDNAALEYEADVMGEKAVQCIKKENAKCLRNNQNILQNTVQCQLDKYPYYNLEVSAPKGPIKAAETVEKKTVVETTTKPKAPHGKKTSVENTHLERINVNLPHIAFEANASIDRKDELVDLYDKEMKRYEGKASVFMGVNTCLASDALGEIAKKIKNVDDAAGMIENVLKGKKIRPGHEITIVPFAYRKVGKTGDDYRFPFFEARGLLMNIAKGSGADLYRWIDSDARNDSSIQAINENGYDFVLKNETELGSILEILLDDCVLVKKIMQEKKEDLKTMVETLPEGKKETLKKMMETNPEEINGEFINAFKGLVRTEKKVRDIVETYVKRLGAEEKERYKQFVGKNLFKGVSGPRLYSGFYEWRTILPTEISSKQLSYYRLRLNKITELVNKYEIKVRMLYLGVGKLMNAIRKGYYPESAIYMNPIAHSKAEELLVGKDDEFNRNKNVARTQSRESEFVVDGLTSHSGGIPFISVDERFTLTKPLKKQEQDDEPARYSKPLEELAGRNNPGNEPITEFGQFKEKIKGLRQSAFDDQWGVGGGDEKETLLKKMFDEWIDYLLELSPLESGISPMKLRTFLQKKSELDESATVAKSGDK